MQELQKCTLKITLSRIRINELSHTETCEKKKERKEHAEKRTSMASLWLIAHRTSIEKFLFVSIFFFSFFLEIAGRTAISNESCAISRPLLFSDYLSTERLNLLFRAAHLKTRNPLRWTKRFFLSFFFSPIRDTCFTTNMGTLAVPWVHLSLDDVPFRFICRECTLPVQHTYTHDKIHISGVKIHTYSWSLIFVCRT